MIPRPTRPDPGLPERAGVAPPEPPADYYDQPAGRVSALAESILRKAIAEPNGRLMVERYPTGIDALIDSSWFDITPEEADYLDQLRPDAA